MPMLPRAISLWRNLTRRSRVEQELDDDLRATLQLLVDEHVAAGIAPAEARRLATIELGGVEPVKERVRDARAGAVVEGVVQDLRYAFRLFRRSPGFAVVAVLSLALGIGANAAVFNLLNAVVLRKLDVRRPEQLVSVTTLRRDGTMSGLSYPMFHALARDQRVFSSWIGYWGDGVFNIDVDGTLVRGVAWAVTGNFFPELGTVPHQGRLLGEADVDLDHLRPEMAAVLGYGIWQREFGGDPAVIGRTVKVDGVPFTIVGIGPRGFKAFGITSEPDVTIPLTAAPLVMPGTPTDRFTTRQSQWVFAVGRLRDRIGLTEARAQLIALWPNIVSETRPPDLTGVPLNDFMASRLDVVSASRGRDAYLRRRFTQPLYIVLSIAGLILLIACVNLASLMLSRTTARSHELSVRLALGASRWRLARQMLIEGLLLSAVAAWGALIFAWYTSELLKSIMTRDFNVPSALNVAPDARVFAFTAVTAVAAGVLFSLIPAWRATRREPGDSPLLQSARAVTGTTRVGKALIVAEVALSLMLLMAAGLLVRTLQQLKSVDVGFRRDHMVIASRFPVPNGYKDFDPEHYYPALTERVAALPGVQNAVVVKTRPGDFRATAMVTKPDAPDGGVQAALAPVGPQFFRALDIAQLSGRDVAWSDTAKSRRVAVISRSLAQRLFGSADAIGQRIHLRGDLAKGDAEVVGIVADARLMDPHNPNTLAAYVPLLQSEYEGRWGDVIVRSAGASVGEPDVRRAVLSLGRELVLTYRSLHQVSDRAILEERVTGLLAGFFGVLALALSAIGLYGLMAYAVAQRTRELAIRLALGARRGEVLSMVVRETMTLVGIGIAIGLPLALISGRVVQSLLFGLTPSDPIALLAIVAMLAVVGLCAGYLPGLRASKVEPMEALRL
jgi:predicted permease